VIPAWEQHNLHAKELRLQSERRAVLVVDTFAKDAVPLSGLFLSFVVAVLCGSLRTRHLCVEMWVSVVNLIPE
jgi:hypothetical protein